MKMMTGCVCVEICVYEFLLCLCLHVCECVSVSERKAHVRLLSECRFQTENSVVRGNTLHHTDGHGPRGIQGEIAQAGTGRGPSM